MKATRWLLGLATGSAVVAAVASGCGGGTNGAAPIVEGGTDGPEDVTMVDHVEAAVEAAPADAAPDVKDAAPKSDACVPDANINMLPVPDASLNDSGATAAACVACVQQNCGTLIKQCNESCACVDAFEQFELCIGEPGQSLEQCALEDFQGIPGISITSFACALGCETPCGVNMMMTPDSGKSDGSSTSDGASGEASTSDASND
jgi:hypothetical protein